MKTQEDIDRQNRTDTALESVNQERDEQHLKWGTQRHDWPVWLTVLAEEQGELAQAILRLREAEHQGLDGLRPTILVEMRNEAVQVAAVAVAMIEHIDEVLSPPAPSAHADNGQDFWDERTRRWQQRTRQASS